MINSLLLLSLAAWTGIPGPAGVTGAELLSTSGAGLPSSSGAETRATAVGLRVGRLHVGDGTVLENAVVVVQGTKVLSVSAADGGPLPKDTVIIELEGELSPGLVALRDYATMRGENVDATRNVMPTADLAWAFDPDHRDTQALIAAGITTAILAAPGTELVGGLAPAVDPGSGAIVKRGALLCVGAGARALAFNRFPTSTSGQYDELERLFTTSTGAAGQVFQRAKQRTLPVLLDVTDRADVLRAAAFAKRHGLAGALIGAMKWGDVIEAVKDAGLSVVIGPIWVGGEGEEAARQAVRVARAGIRIGFAVDTPENHPALLRASAARCVRAGLEPAAALRALTSDAAAIAGVAGQTGKIAPGLEADLVLWSGPPTELTSRVLRVWSDGQIVHDAATAGSQQ